MELTVFYFLWDKHDFFGREMCSLIKKKKKQKQQQQKKKDKKTPLLSTSAEIHGCKLEFQSMLYVFILRAQIILV